MHDMFEGVFPLTLKLVKLINKSIIELNEELQKTMFDSYSEMVSVTQEVGTGEHLNKTNNQINRK